MGGGGGGIFGTILNVVSFVYPPLRPVAIAYNMVNSAANGNVLGMIGSAFGASNYLDAGVGDFGGINSGGDNFSGNEWNGVDTSIEPSWVSNPTTGLQELSSDSSLQSQIANGGAQEAASDVIQNAREAGIAAGSEGSALDTINNYYDPTKFNTEALQGQVTDSALGTQGGYQAASGAVKGLNEVVSDLSKGTDNMQSGLYSMGSYGGNTTEGVLGNLGKSAVGDPTSVSLSGDGGAGAMSYMQSPTAPGTGAIDGMSPPAQGMDSLNSATDNRFSGEDPFKDTASVNKDYNHVTGYGIDNGYGKGVSGLPMGTEGSLQNMWNRAGSPIEKPSTLSSVFKGLGGVDSYLKNKKAMSSYEEMLNMAKAADSGNAARGQFANEQWQQSQSDPMYGYSSFMQGAGRDFTNNARAAAAKSGNRGGYLNSGRMNSDLASLWQKNQTQRSASLAGGFSNNPHQASAALTPGYAGMIKNQNAPLFDAASQIMQGNKLSDLFGDW